MNHKILICRESILHDLICKFYINGNKKCLLKSSRVRRDTELRALFQEINNIIRDSYAKEFEWDEWYIGFEPCSLGEMLNHNVSIFVRQGREEKVI